MTTSMENLDDILSTPMMDVSVFLTKLETTAALFLDLLHESKFFKAQLSSISVVSDIIHFFQDDTDSGLKQVREEATQTQLVFQDIERLYQKTSDSEEKIVTTTRALRSLRGRGKKSGDSQSRNKTQLNERKGKPRVKRSNNKTNNKLEKNDRQKQTEQTSEETVDEDSKDLSEEYEEHSETSNGPIASELSKPETLSEFQCSYCYKVFIDRRNLKSHLWVHEREKSFKCDVCNKTFLRSHQLTRHRRVHTGEKPYPCPVCGKTFADVSNLNTHKKKDHPSHTALLRCEECGKECENKRDLQAHLASHDTEDAQHHAVEETEQEDQKANPGSGPATLKMRLRRMPTPKRIHGDREPFLCQICGKGLNKRAALLAHMKRHINKKDFRCEFCDKVFHELRELKAHRHEHSGERPYKCHKCGKGFKSQGTLRSHLAVHKGEQPYSCDVCGRTFSQTSGLNLHKLKHTAEEERNTGTSKTDPNQLICDICGRCYKTKFRLQLHMKSHDSKRDVSCDYCDKKFQTAQDLTIHRRSHTQDKYSCRVCGASFKSRSVYYFHTRTHQIERPHLCSTCGKSFVSVGDLNAHKRRHLPNKTNTKPNDRFICNVCGRIYQMKNSLLIHMKIHQGIFDHPCDFCEKKFKSHAELRHHRRVHTQEKPYVCETCKRCFSRHSTLVNHRRTHSGERPYLCMTCGAAFKLACTLKKHSKIHIREAQGGKPRAHSGRPKAPRPVPVPSPPSDPELPPPPQQQQQDQLNQHLQLQQQQQQQQLHPPQPQPSLPLAIPSHVPVTIAVSQLIQKPSPMLVDAREQTTFVHELKSVPISLMQDDSSGLIHDRNSTTLLLDPRNPSTNILQPLREPGPSELDERETARNLLEMRNAVPNPVQYNPGNNTFTTYYYY